MPNSEGKGFVDYVLWGDDGKPLGARRGQAHADATPRVGQQQAKLYADCLETAVRPAAGHLLLQRLRALDLGRRELSAAPGAGLLQEGRAGAADPAAHEPQAAGRRRRSTTRSSSATTRRAPSAASARRSRRDHERKALLVMATGAGKTRTVIALCDLLMRCNWAKRVLFLADRVALVNQAVNAFKTHLPDASPVNLVTEKDDRGPRLRLDLPDDDGPDRRDDGRPAALRRRALRPRHHRRGAPLGVPEVPGDLRLLRLAARRPDRHAEGRGRPQHLRPVRPGDAACRPTPTRSTRRCSDGFLVPPRAVSVPLKFQREGIKYDDLSEEEKEQWDALEWDEDGSVPDRVEAAGGQQVAVQQGHRRQGARAPDDARPEGRRRRPARQDDHLRQEPGARRVHRRALRRELPALQGRVRPRHHLQDANTRRA